MIKKRWDTILADDVLKRLFKNLTYLFSARMLSALIGLLTLAVTARAIGPAGLGIIALIEAYARSVDQVFHFEPWQAVVRYGAAALEDERQDDFRQLVKFSTLFDLFGASLSTLMAVCGLALAVTWLEFDQDQIWMAIAFSLTLLLSMSSTPTAILRLFDKFDVIARITVAVSLVRLILTLIAWWFGDDLWYFVVVMMVSKALEQLTPLAMAWRELRHRGYSDVWRLPLRGLLVQNTGLPSFLWNANINVIARTSTLRFDTLILGAMLGPAAAGLYLLAKRTGLAALLLGRPIQQAVYPEVARLWVHGEISRFRRIVLGVNAVIATVAAIVLLVAALNMDLLVRVAFGDAFLAAAPLIIVQALAITIFLAGNTLNPALLSMGADRALVRVTLTATVAFFVAFVPLINLFGALGASLSHVLFNAIWLTGCLYIFLRRTRSVTR